MISHLKLQNIRHKVNKSVSSIHKSGFYIFKHGIYFLKIRPLKQQYYSYEDNNHSLFKSFTMLGLFFILSLELVSTEKQQDTAYFFILQNLAFFFTYKPT